MKKVVSLLIITFQLGIIAYAQPNPLVSSAHAELDAPHIIEARGRVTLDKQLTGAREELGGGIPIVDTGIIYFESTNAALYFSCPDNHIRQMTRESIGAHVAFESILRYCPDNSYDYCDYGCYKGFSNYHLLDAIYQDRRLSTFAKAYASALVWARAGEYVEAIETINDYKGRYGNDGRFYTLIRLINQALTGSSYR